MAIFRRKITKPVKRSIDTSLGIKELARIATENGLAISPIDLDSLLKALKIRLKKIPMDPEVSGYLKQIDNNWVIGVNSLHHSRRQRFTIAHELAHFMLHKQNMDSFEDTVLFRNGETNPIEVEANQFAARLLMPQDEFLDYLRNVSSKIDDIAEHFGVSTMAVRIRAKTLKLKGHGL